MMGSLARLMRVPAAELVATRLRPRTVSSAAFVLPLAPLTRRTRASSARLRQARRRGVQSRWERCAARQRDLATPPRFATARVRLVQWIALRQQQPCAALQPARATWPKSARVRARLVRRTDLRQQQRCAGLQPACATWPRAARVRARLVRRTGLRQQQRYAGLQPMCATWPRIARAPARLVRTTGLRQQQRYAVLPPVRATRPRRAQAWARLAPATSPSPTTHPAIQAMYAQHAWPGVAPVLSIAAALPAIRSAGARSSASHGSLAYPSRTSTLTSFVPCAGSGTTDPSTAFPSTVNETRLPFPCRFTSMA